MSMPAREVLTPNCSPSRARSATSPACSSALVGMQPRCRHVPPTLSFSIRTTFSPSSAARSAVAPPSVGKITMPAPAPRTTTGVDVMGLFDRLRGRGAGSGSGRRGTLDRGSHRGDLDHLEQFVASRRGVEGYVEQRTSVTETTIVLVAADGEWTRRRIDGPEVARRLSRDLAIPVYDAQVTGYPQRMRDWSSRQTDN